MASEQRVSAPNIDQLIDTVISQFQTYKANLTNQVNSAFTRLTPKDVIRLVIIAGAYCLLRPYLLKLGARFQAQDHERELDHEEIQAMRKSEGYNKSGLGGVEIPDDTDESEDDGPGTGVDWGKSARRRQRRVMRQLLEAEERRRAEEEEAESDKELEQWMEK